MKLSVAMLAYNEEKLIGETLKACSFVDEIVVVDAESTDRTADICREYGATVITRPNIPMLNINKNIAIDACHGEWVILLDADERITPESREEILRTIANPKFDSYLFPRLNHILGKGMRWGWVYPDYQLRLFRRGKFRFEEQHIHERLAGEGKFGILKHPLMHETYPEADMLIRKLQFNAKWEAGNAWRKGVRPSAGLAWKWLFWKPFSRTLERYFLKLGFLDGFAGVTSCVFDSMNFVMRFLYLVEWARNPERAPKE